MRADVRQVADGTYLVHGSNTNWVILTDGDAVTLIDTGYPGDRELVLDSLASVGSSPEAITAVLVTHAHNDHLGSAEHLRATYGVPVYLHEAEVPHARREFLHQVSVGEVLRNAWRPGVLPWMVHALRSGGTEQHPVTAPEAFPAPRARWTCPAGRSRCTPRATPTGTPSSTSRTAGRRVAGTRWSAGTRRRASAGRSCCRTCSTTARPRGRVAGRDRGTDGRAAAARTRTAPPGVREGRGPAGPRARRLRSGHGFADQRHQPGAPGTAAGPALAPAAGGVARGVPGPAAARHLPARRALRPGRRRGRRRQGGQPSGRRVREYELLRDLDRLGIPAVDPIGRGHRAGRRRRRAAGAGAGHPAPGRLAAVPLDVRDDDAARPPCNRLLDALAVLLVRLHLVGFAWGDCSLSNTLFRRDAGAYAAYLVDAETGELQPAAQHRAAGVRHRAGPGEHQRRADGPGGLRVAAPLGGPDRPSARRSAPATPDLWQRADPQSVYPAGKQHYIDRRIRRLNDLGFDVAEMQIQHSPNGDTVTFVPKVVDAGHHQRQLLRLTGLDTEENQARRLLNDLESWMATQDDYAPGDPLARPPGGAGAPLGAGRLPAHRAGGAAGTARRDGPRARSTTSCWSTAGTCRSGRSTTSGWTRRWRTTSTTSCPKARETPGADPPGGPGTAAEPPAGADVRARRPPGSPRGAGRRAPRSRSGRPPPYGGRARPTTISWARPATDSSTWPALPISTCSTTGTSGNRSRHGCSASASAFFSYGSRPPASSRSLSEPGL